VRSSSEGTEISPGFDPLGHARSLIIGKEMDGLVCAPDHPTCRRIGCDRRLRGPLKNNSSRPDWCCAKTQTRSRGMNSCQTLSSAVLPTAVIAVLRIEISGQHAKLLNRIQVRHNRRTHVHVFLERRCHSPQTRSKFPFGRSRKHYPQPGPPKVACSSRRTSPPHWAGRCSWARSGLQAHQVRKIAPFSGIEEIFFSASSWPNSVEEGSGIKPSSTTVILSARDSKESFASTRVGFVAPRTSPTWWNGWKEGAEIFSSYRPESPMKKVIALESRRGCLLLAGIKPAKQKPWRPQSQTRSDRSPSGEARSVSRMR